MILLVELFELPSLFIISLRLVELLVSLLLIYTKLMASNVDKEADDEIATSTIRPTGSGWEGKQEAPVPNSQLLRCVGKYAHAFVCTPFAFLSLCI
jgi:hypothetical protein